jgi:LemA protein
MKRTTILALLLALPLGGCGYNRIQALDENVDARQADIEAELLRRNDLIPNLVATVEEAARFEQETFTEVAAARAGLTQARERMAQAVQGDAEAAEMAAASSAVGENLRLFLNVAVEAYPTLTANRSFIALQDELTETENRISVARRDYNDSVQAYNTYIRRFPQTLTARIIGAGRREPFEAPESARAAPRVEFGGSGGGD